MKGIPQLQVVAACNDYRAAFGAPAQAVRTRISVDVDDTMHDGAARVSTSAPSYAARAYRVTRVVRMQSPTVQIDSLALQARSAGWSKGFGGTHGDGAEQPRGAYVELFGHRQHRDELAVAHRAAGDSADRQAALFGVPRCRPRCRANALARASPVVAGRAARGAAASALAQNPRCHARRALDASFPAVRTDRACDPLSARRRLLLRFVGDASRGDDGARLS